MKRTLIALATLIVAAPAGAADLVVAKAWTLVSDPLGTVRPRILPGSRVEYSVTVTNPLLNGVTIRNVEVVDTIGPALALSLADVGASGSGPVEVVDGGLLGLLGSGLVPAGVDYSVDGRNWGYRPVGVTDPQVRAIRVRLTGTQAAGGSFRLRYRAVVR